MGRDRRASRDEGGEGIGKERLTATWGAALVTDEVLETLMRREKLRHFTMCHSKHFSIFPLFAKHTFPFKPFILMSDLHFLS